MSTMVEAEGSVKKKEFVSVSPSVSLFVSRGILIQIFFSLFVMGNWAYLQVVSFCSLVSEQFLLLLKDVSFPCW